MRSAALRPIHDFAAYLFDLDGTVYLGPELIPGAREALQSLKRAGRKVMYLSNKPISTRAEYAAKLTKLGIPTEEDAVLNSSQALAHYLAREMPGARAYVIGEAPVIEDLVAAGLRITNEPGLADVVVASWDRDLNYRKLDDALQALNRGARFVATNPDVACPMPGACTRLIAVQSWRRSKPARAGRWRRTAGSPRWCWLSSRCRVWQCPRETA